MNYQFTWNFRGRMSTRIPGYDYAQAGHYAVTISTHERRWLFGQIEQGHIRLNNVGMMVFNQWMELVNKYDHIRLDAFVIMPNHIHGIIEFTESHPDSHHGIRSRVFPDAIDGSHPHQSEITAWIERHNATRINHIPNTPIIPLRDTRVGATLRGRPESVDQHPRRGDHDGSPLPTLGSVVGWFKSMSTNGYINGVKQHGWSRFQKRLWQRNYWESILWRDEDVERMREYILANPRNWERDADYSPT